MKSASLQVAIDKFPEDRNAATGSIVWLDILLIQLYPTKSKISGNAYVTRIHAHIAYRRRTASRIERSKPPLHTSIILVYYTRVTLRYYMGHHGEKNAIVT